MSWNTRYHSSQVGPNGTHNGKTWRDMPGTDESVKKMNFALFRRGLYRPGDYFQRKMSAAIARREQAAALRAANKA